MSTAQTAKSLFEVYAFCEGMWRTPAWVFAVDLTAHPIDPETLRANVREAMAPKKAA